MATKKCVNGHQYDANIYGDKCPFCPASGTKLIEDNSFGGAASAESGAPTRKTSLINKNGGGWEKPTEPIKTPPFADEKPAGGGMTIIRHASPSGETHLGSDNRRLVALLVSYDIKKSGEVYRIYEGRNIIGRAATADIPVPSDMNMSGTHLLILFREAENIFWAVDQNSSNGTYINGVFVGDRVQLKTNDVIVVGGTKFIFMAIPQ